MKKLSVVVVLLLAFSCLAYGQAKKQAPPSAPAKAPSAEQELIKLEKEWADAAVKADVAALDHILADDFVSTDFEGTLWDKAKSLALMKSGEDKASSAVLDDMKARVYGDAAVVTGRATVKQVYKGRDLSGQYRFTDTFVKRGGRWQCVASQGTKIVKK
jgi:ketosteroid isomerase-like protein